MKNLKCKKFPYCTLWSFLLTFLYFWDQKNRWNRIQSSICGSQICDDLSLFDLTRNSEDSHWTGNHNDDKVAVLEFELRKARETIFNLREELTQQTKTRYISKTFSNLECLSDYMYLPIAQFINCNYISTYLTHLPNYPILHSICSCKKRS